jgi:hypothetical protein
MRLSTFWQVLRYLARAIDEELGYELIVLSFNVIVPIGHGTCGNFTGNTFIVERLGPNLRTEAESIAKNRPLLAKASNSWGEWEKC